jgi:type I restriction enzyme S subunit
MKSGWETKPLNDVADFYNGLWKGVKPPFTKVGVIRNTNFQKNGTLNDSDIAYLDVETKKLSTRKLEQGDIVLEKSGGGPKQPVGRVALFEGMQGTFSFSNFTSAIRVRNPKQLYYRYLHLYLLEKYISGTTEKMQSHSTGIRNLDGRAYKGIEVRFPKIDHQKHIVSNLEKAFAAITVAEKNEEKIVDGTLELSSILIHRAITGSLTASWRLNGTGPGAKLVCDNTGRFRRSRRGISDVDLSGQGSEIEVPESWTVSSPERICEFIVDCPHSTPKWTDVGEVCLRTTNFKPGFLDLESVRYVSPKTYRERIERLEPKPGDVLYSREGGILGVACMIPDGSKVCLGQRMMLFRMDTKAIDPNYFCMVMNSNFILSKVKNLIGGSAAPHLNIRDIRGFPIPLPPIQEQMEIVRIFKIAVSALKHLQLNSKKKADLHDGLRVALLQKAFAGELRGALS